MPRIDGLDKFKGVLAHTANYPEGLDLKGKRVAVCGIGSSGIQVIAAIQKDVSKLYTWIRTPTWILGSFGAKYLEEEDTNPPCNYHSPRVYYITTNIPSKTPKSRFSRCDVIQRTISNTERTSSSASAKDLECISRIHQRQLRRKRFDMPPASSLS